MEFGARHGEVGDVEAHREIESHSCGMRHRSTSKSVKSFSVS